MDEIRRIRCGDEQYVNLNDLISFCERLSVPGECEVEICEAMQVVAMSLRYSFLLEPNEGASI